jgi:hypothetical protein
MLQRVGSMVLQKMLVQGAWDQTKRVKTLPLLRAEERWGNIVLQKNFSSARFSALCYRFHLLMFLFLVRIMFPGTLEEA